MFTKLQKSKGESGKGFTIIEVMIVLAIAGLIILIVLLAVPALQRNGRNTAMKNDASAIAAGISEYQSNNDGGTPTDIAGTNGTVAITGTGTAAQARVQGGTDVARVLSTGAQPANLTPGQIRVWAGHRCNGNTSTRAFAIYYAIENSGGNATVCLDS